MINAVVVALIAVAVAVIIQRLALRQFARELKIREQSFRFHALRDQLQELAIEGKIDPTSEVFDITVFMVNLGIRNVGDMKLSHVIEMARQLESRVEPDRGFRFFRAVKSLPREVQETVADVFKEFGKTLVRNDWLVSARFAILTLGQATSRRVVHRLLEVGDHLVQIIDPTRGEVVRIALKYQGYGNRLARSG